MEVKELLKNLGFENFSNENLILEALTHRSFSREHNERLEFLGDAVLELVITELLYLDFPDKTEGELTSFRAALVKSESLADEASKLNVGNFIRMSKGEEATGGRSRQYILADVLEAIIGAIYLQEGYTGAKVFIQSKIYYKIQNIVSNRLDIDAKSKLQEYAQEKFKETPQYKLIKEEGPDHEKVFTVQVMIGKEAYETGVGKSKQVAEQMAAERTLERIKQNIQ